MITEDFLSSPDVIDEAELSLVTDSGEFLFENVFLTNEIIDAQKEVIITLGEIVETRSHDAVVL